MLKRGVFIGYCAGEGDVARCYMEERGKRVPVSEVFTPNWMIRPLLSKIRRRLAWQAFSRYAVRYGVAAGVLFFGLMLLLAPRQLVVAGGVLALFVGMAAALSAFFSRPTLEQVAQQMDAAAATRDRLITALNFSTRDGGRLSAEWQQSILAECETYLSKVDFKQHARWRLPREARWLPLPLVAICALSLFQHGPAFLSAGAKERPPDARIVQKAEELEKMAEKMGQSETDKKIAEALKKAAEALRAEAVSESPEKALLRELSALEQALQEAKQGGNAIESLAKAFEKAESLSRTAEALKKGELGAAADELEQAAQNMREMLEQMQAAGRSPAMAGESNAQQGEQAENRELTRFEKAMRAAAEQMGEKSPMGEAASQAASASQRRDGQQTEQAMQRMAESIRRSQPGQPQDRDKAQAQIDASIARLREMKQGQQEGDAVAQMAQGQGQGMGDPGDGQNGQPQQGSGTEAAGQPGSERDEGTKASPFGNEETPLAEQSLAAQLQGILGEGESLHSLTPTHGGKDEARRNYKALYEAAAPEAEDALDRENIPIGSRLYIKRYFEAIRPRQ